MEFGSKEEEEEEEKAREFLWLKGMHHVYVCPFDTAIAFVMYELLGSEGTVRVANKFLRVTISTKKSCSAKRNTGNYQAFDCGVSIVITLQAEKGTD